MASAARRQIIGGGTPINKSRRRRPQIVGGAARRGWAGARLYLTQRRLKNIYDVWSTYISFVTNAL